MSMKMNGERMMVMTCRNYSVGSRQMYDERRMNRVAVAALLLALASVLTLVATGPLYRTGRVSLTTAFTIMRWAAYGGVASLLLGVIGAIIAARRGSGMAAAVAALVIVVGGLALPASWLRQASRVPRIHDISTDTDRPPTFVAIVPLRAGARNPIEYGGPEIAAQQHQGYPDIAPLTLSVPPSQAFDRALAATRAMGWELVASDPATGRIEATDTTFWFGFKDDIVVRVTPAAGGSRVDVRSLSRVGLSDVGTNAARIRRFVKTVSESRTS
jgi:uncharacterized protein (DUF1499 family)